MFSFLYHPWSNSFGSIFLRFNNTFNKLTKLIETHGFFLILKKVTRFLKKKKHVCFFI